MDTTLRYESNNGTVVEFAPSSRYHYTGATLHDYEHQYNSVNNRITRFYDEITEFELDVVVAGDTTEDRNRMVEAFEYDVQRLKPGKLWCGGYYLECYVTASSKDSWWWEDGHMAASLTITSESAKWVHEEFHLFVKGEKSGTGIDYEHDWGYDFTSNIMVQYITNTNIIPAPFVILVTGPADHGISINIGGNTYAVDIALEDGQLLTIDSRTKRIYTTDRDGTVTNIFSKRVGRQVEGSGEYIFEPIASGSNLVGWDNTYTFGLTVFDERAEPRW